MFLYLKIHQSKQKKTSTKSSAQYDGVQEKNPNQLVWSTCSTCCSEKQTITYESSHNCGKMHYFNEFANLPLLIYLA